MGSYSRAGSALAATIAGLGLLSAGAAPASAAAPLPCDASALVAAINAANAGTGTRSLQLASNCTYDLTTPASTGTRGANGLPIIKTDITLIGHRTVIRRTGGPNFRIMEVAQGKTLVATGITFTGGDAGPWPGGAILNARGRLILQLVRLTGNRADAGGGLANDRGPVTLVSSTVDNNTSVGGGGGIYNDGTLNMPAGLIYNNTAGTDGGGLYNELGGQATLSATRVLSNDAGDDGGGVYNGDDGRVTLSAGRITGNTADDGGGVYNDDDPGDVLVSGTRITANSPNNCAPPGTVPGCTG